MSLRVVLFDLDGTLLPMDQEVFLQGYFSRLVAKMAPYGYDPQQLVKGIWAGTEGMIRNDGSRTNEEVFWSIFPAVCGSEIRSHVGTLEEFYRNEFQQVRYDVGFDPNAAKAVSLVKELGLRAVLATNPVFPSVATESRIRWAGLQVSDFEYVTTYENSFYSKPNPEYYRSILQRICVPPEEVLMVGNDVLEDMVAEALGMKVFLLTDCVINKKGADVNQWPHGGYEELFSYLSQNAK